MKKVLAICLMMVMVMSMSATVFAAPGAFVSSPSGNSEPRVVSFKPKDGGCTGGLDIVPYSERDTLSEEHRKLIEKAYEEIVDTEDLTSLNTDLSEIAADKKIEGDDLAVSDLFDMVVTGCGDHDGHMGFDIVLKADTLDKFVALLQMNEGGKWELVKDAKVTGNGEQLEFSVDILSPLAIVVDAGDSATDAPQTGDNTMIYVYAIVMAGSALAMATVVVKSRKRRA